MVARLKHVHLVDRTILALVSLVLLKSIHSVNRDEVFFVISCGRKQRNAYS
jgi:hypothetical protein